MLKRWLEELGPLQAAAILLGVLASLLLLSFFGYPPEAVNDHSPAVAYYEAAKQLPHKLETVGVIAAIGAAIFTGLLAYYANMQIVQSRQSAEMQLRAYVFIKAVNIDNLGDGQTPRVEIEFENFGQTPAYNYRHIGAIGIRRFPLQEFPEIMDEASEPSPVGPGASTNFVIRCSSSISMDQIELIRSAKLGIYVMGQYEYETVFGQKVIEPIRLMCVGRLQYDEAKMGTYNAFHIGG